MVCYFFCLIFVIMGVPGGPVCQGGCSGGVLGVFRWCSGASVPGSFWPVPGFTDTLKSQGRIDHYGFESSLWGNTR